jgi:hypothetical protein
VLLEEILILGATMLCSECGVETPHIIGWRCSECNQKAVALGVPAYRGPHKSGEDNVDRSLLCARVRIKELESAMRRLIEEAHNDGEHIWIDADAWAEITKDEQIVQTDFR